uniref:SFRICE_002299 n=1 Tax=Spodoptera frugiperda TaxID=7108 RepID=A0A2H1WRM3_SPOFR
MQRKLATFMRKLGSKKFIITYYFGTKIFSYFHKSSSLVLYSQLPKKPSIKNMSTRTTNLMKPSINQDYGGSREKQSPISRSFFSPARPMSPKGRRSPQTTSFY